jgi:hypothetical protein
MSGTMGCRIPPVAHAPAAMPYHPSHLVRHAWANAPGCLAEVRAEPLWEPPADFNAHDDLACFQVSCRCGSTGWHILGHRQIHPDTLTEVFLSPVSLQCEQCNRAFPVFDIETHGYDAVLCGGCWSMRGGNPQRWSCRHCGGITFDAYPCFSYQLEAEDFEQNAPFGPTFGPAELAHIQDFFDWFQLDARCRACGTFDTPIDYECA